MSGTAAGRVALAGILNIRLRNDDGRELKAPKRRTYVVKSAEAGVALPPKAREATVRSTHPEASSAR